MSLFLYTLSCSTLLLMYCRYSQVHAPGPIHSMHLQFERQAIVTHSSNYGYNQSADQEAGGSPPVTFLLSKDSTGHFSLQNSSKVIQILLYGILISLAICVLFFSYCSCTRIIRYLHGSLSRMKICWRVAQARNDSMFQFFKIGIRCVWYTVWFILVVLLSISTVNISALWFLLVILGVVKSKRDTPRPNPVLPKPRCVTRNDIDCFSPDYDSDWALGFEYTNPDHSFCKRFKPRQDSELSRGKETCCICIEGYTSSQMVLELPCGHRYHYGCILSHRVSKTEQLGFYDDLKEFACLLCRLNVMKHYLYYREHGWTVDEVPYENK